VNTADNNLKVAENADLVYQEAAECVAEADLEIKRHPTGNNIYAYGAGMYFRMLLFYFINRKLHVLLILKNVE